MGINRETIRQIKDQIDLVEVVAQYVHLERRGDRWWGLSPFKTENTPSFTVRPDEGFFYCFATQKGGDVFTFIGEMEGLSFAESVRHAAGIAGIRIEEDTVDASEERERSALRELYTRVATTFHYLLTEDRMGRAAREYLAGRGISDSSIEEFQLGYAPEPSGWLSRFLRGKRYSDAFLAGSGLFSRNYPGMALFRDRVMFPISDERGQIRAFGARALRPEERAKYINSPDTPIYSKKATLFGLKQAVVAIREGRRAIVAEGYIDVIAFHQTGHRNAVAPLGTAFTDRQARLLKRWSDEVVLVFDADAAGLDAALRAAVVAEGVGLACKAAPVVGGKDPGDLLTGGGKPAIDALLGGVVAVFDYLLAGFWESFEGEAERADLLLRKLFPYIRVINSDVRREQALDQLSDYVGASRGAVQADFDNWNRGARRERVEQDAARQERVPISRDLALVLATAQTTELFVHLRRHVSAESLEDPVARRVFLLIEDAFRHGEATLRGLVDRLTDEPLRDAVLARLTSGEFDGWSTRDVDSGIRVLQQGVLQDAQRDLERKLRAADPENAPEIRRLQLEKMAIDQEIAALKEMKS